MKIAGTIIKEFVDSDWNKILGEDWYVEHDASSPVFNDDGSAAFDASIAHDPMDLLWYLQWQGRGNQPNTFVVCGKSIPVSDDGLDPTKVIRAWMSTLDSVDVLVRVPTNKVNALAKWIEKAGGSIVS